MKKDEILKQKRIKLRKVNAKDKACARTDYQRKANYIIVTSNKKEYYSTNGSLKDCLKVEELSRAKKLPTKDKKGKRNGKKTGKK